MFACKKIANSSDWRFLIYIYAEIDSYITNIIQDDKLKKILDKKNGGYRYFYHLRL